MNPHFKIPFHRAAVGEEEAQAAAAAIRSGWLTMGPKTLEFEEKFAQYIGTPYAIAVSSCTAGLHLALEAAHVGPGDEVLLPTNTFTATAEVVVYVGARPVLVDVDPQTLNLDPNDAERRISPRTKAIIPVHLAGQPCDMHEIAALAARHGLQVIEDAAHALPASYRGKNIGTLSPLTVFSFYATKTLTTGEGGMVTTDAPEFAERMRIMRLHGIERDAWKRYSADGSWFYHVLEAGYKYNLTDPQAAVGLVQLAKCNHHHALRLRIAQRYTQAFQQHAAVEPPLVRGDRESAWHLYILRLNLDRLRLGRDEFIHKLAERGIGTSVHFIPLHLQPYYQRCHDYRRGDLLVAEREYERCISLPIFPGMSDDEVTQVIRAVVEIADAWQA